MHACSVNKINVTYLYSLSCSNVTSTGKIGRIERQGFDPKTAFIMATTEDMRSWMKDYPKVHDRIIEITKNAIAFQCHPDKFNLAVVHSLTYFFEYEHLQWQSRLCDGTVLQLWITRVVR